MGLDRVLVGSIGPAIEWLMGQPKMQPLVRVVCPPQFQNDPVGQGNTLARAINHDLKLDLLGQGLSWTYASTLLRLHQHTLGPFTLVVFCAENATEMALDLMALEGVQIILHFMHQAPPELAGVNTIELETKPKKRNPPRTLTALRMRMEGNIERNNWVPALSIAASHFPAELPGLLQKVGWPLMAQGMAHRLEEELAKVEGEFAHHPEVLRWRLAAALDGWNHTELLPLVGEVLASQDHPELRSYYALGLHSLYRYDESRHHIELALAAERSPVVLANAGYIAQHGNLSLSFNHLNDALKQAELENLPLLQSQILVSLAQASIQDCNPQKAYEWARWAMQVMEHHNINNIPLRLLVFNELSYVRVLLGDTLGIEAQLKQESACMARANRRVRNLLDWTLAEALLVEGRSGEAAYVMEQIWNRIQQRESFVVFAMTYVVALLEIGENQKVLEVVTKAATLNPHLVRAQLPKLAFQSLVDPYSITDDLRSLRDNLDQINIGIEYLQASLFLARAYLAIGQTSEAETLLGSLRPTINRFSLQGLRALVGPSEAFAEVFALLSPSEEPLELEFMGKVRARLNGKPLNVRPRQADVLAAMALNPSGYTVERLALDLYGERGSPASARAELHRLGELVPIESKPYRLSVAYKADFLEIKKYLSLGDVRGALNLYRGPLLPQSTAPLVEQERMLLEDVLREVVAHTGDPEAILAMTEVMKNDLQLLELAVERLPKFDPRRAIVEVQRRQLEQSWH